MAVLFKVTQEVKGTDEAHLYDVFAVHYGGPFRAEFLVWDFELEKFKWIESRTCKLAR